MIQCDSKTLVTLCSFLLTATLTLSCANAVSADLERGRALHETHCHMCHDSVAYRRDKKLAQTVEDVRAQVARWQANSSLHWSDEDIDNVTAYLVKTYYKLPCPNC
jgi:mono/diheme cytochrome c family protein